MKRRAGIACAGLSVCLCLAISTLAVRSIWYVDHWRLPGERYRSIKIEGGRIDYVRQNIPGNWPHGRQEGFAGVQIMRNTFAQPALSYHHRRSRFASISCVMIPVMWVSVPLWPLILLTAIGPAAILAIHRLRRRRIAAGCCPACGYDCRATPARCPECGHATAAAATSR